jgi:hypothetical protein
MFFSMRSTFWNRIEIEWRDDDDIFLELQVANNVTEIVHFFLDCTRGAPFSFKLCPTGCCPEGETHYNNRLTLVALINCSEQWEDVFIQLYTTELVYLCAIGGRLSQLKKLEIIVEEDPEFEYQYVSRTIPSMITNVFEDAPRLKEVVLGGFSTWQFQLNWSSLAAISFHPGIGRKKTLAVLRETINLVELTIERRTNRHLGLNIKTNDLIHLPHLERLSVDDVALLAVLETPSLQRLKIDFSIFLDDGGMSAAFLRRCGIKLNTLVTHGGPIASIKEILLSAPELDQLVLFNVMNIADLFVWMAGTETQEVRFNRLQLHASYHYWPRAGWGALHDLIARRNPPNNGRSLSPKAVSIQISDMDKSEVANLKSLCRDRGIRFGLVDMSILPWGVDREWY